ncbi:LuxR C-terminal-related transcriptional regulator [Microbacterium sp. NPDC055988]|uniref:helix-turn-helix transcriptional regulator n=1 Tax=Microbacterium sp. NPDC055988 TaxID=3345671 RepID=UPI0035E26142
MSIAGERLSGRTHMLNRVREHFVTLGWRTLSIDGIEALQRTPLGGIALTGVVIWPDRRGVSTMQAVSALGEQVVADRTVILVDDVEWLDEASWAAISAVTRLHRVPLAFTRLARQAGPSVPATGGVGPVFSLRLPAMSYAEMETALEAEVGARIEQSTMSRVFSKAGGNIGVAAAILESARRTGRMVLEGKSLRATEALWSPALASIAEGTMRGLDADDISALRMLALLGPANLRTARELVKAEVILALEDDGFIDVMETRDGPLVSVHPPLLAEYFRHESLPGKRADALTRIDSSLTESLEGRGTDFESPDATALFVRLAHERTRHRTLVAREDWRTHRSLESAARLLNALAADSAQSPDELATLIADAERLDGTADARAEWTLAHAMFTAHHQNQRAAAIARLRAVAADHPVLAPRLEAEALLLEMGSGRAPREAPLRTIDESELDPAARESVVLVKSYWMLVRGRAEEAHALLEEQAMIDSVDPRLQAALVYAKLGLGQHSAAMNIAQEKAMAAREDFDAPRVRAYEFLTALAAVFTRETDVAEAAIDAANSLGVPAGETPASFVGLNVLSAFFAAQRGLRAVAVEHLAAIETAELFDGPLPGLHRSFAALGIAVLDADLDEARRIARKAGDDLWERGSLLGAAFAYLDGLRVAPNADDWEYARERIAQVGSPGIVRWAAFTEALIRDDPKGLADAVSQVAAAGERTDAAEFARVALERLASRTNVDPGVLATLESIAAAGRRAVPAAYVELTARELEVAELVASGLSNPMIAEALVVSVRTVESHVNKLMKKVGARTRPGIRDHLIGTGMRMR